MDSSYRGRDRPAPLMLLNRRALPFDAWRKIIDCCKFDHAFCHYIVPRFAPCGGFFLLIIQGHAGTAQREDTTSRPRR